MVLNSFRFLDNVKINTIVQTLADQLEDTDRLLFLNRTEVINSDDDDIVGKWKGAVYAADIVAEDQKAPTHDTGSFQFVTNVIPKFKHGATVPENVIKRIDKLDRNLGGNNDLSFFTDWQNRLGEDLVRGIRQRVNDVICGMQRDSYAYNRNGINMGTVTWGMPSDLKATSVADWSDAVNSKPLTDLQTLAVDVAPDAYGEQFNRVTMSSRAFKYLTLSDEFTARMKGDLRFLFPTGGINYKDTAGMRQLLANMINMEIEIYDETFWEKDNAGIPTRKRVLPHNQVILSDSGNDNNRNAMYFANGVVTESIVGNLYGYPGFESGEAFGPISYYEPGGNLKPPTVEAYAVLRGFPVKVRETCTAVLTVGSGSNWTN